MQEIKNGIDRTHLILKPGAKKIIILISAKFFSISEYTHFFWKLNDFQGLFF